MTDPMTTVTKAIPPGMMPNGTFWDAGGASFQAEADGGNQRGWHWRPCNARARQQGEPIGDLVPYWPIVGKLPRIEHGGTR